MDIIAISHDGGNATPRIVDAVSRLRSGTAAQIQFEPGVYRLSPDGACRRSGIGAGYVMDSVKDVLFNLENLEEVTIDGNGAELSFTDRMFPFHLHNCRNITLKNFTIDFSCSMFTQGTVAASDESGFELAIDRSLFKYRVDSEGHIIFRCGRQEFSSADPVAILLGNEECGIPPWDYIFAGSTQADMTHLPVGYLLTDAVETANGVRFNYRPESRRLTFPAGQVLFFNYLPRQNVNIMINSCRDIRVENVKIYRGGGMGIVAELSENLSYERVQIMPRPGRRECKSTTADGMFFTQCSGLVSIRSCRVSRTLDDALNFHGIYTRVVAADGNAIRVEACVPWHRGILPYRPGDRLRISDPETQKLKAHATVLDAKMSPDGSIAITLEGAADGVKASDLVENSSRRADFLFEGNHFDRFPHLRISGNGKIIIRDNRFERIECLYFCDLLQFWFESGVVRDLLVEGNEFVDCPWNGDSQYAVTVESTRKDSTDVRNRGIVIRNNRFIGGDGKAIRVQLADGVEIRGNHYHLKDGISPVEICDCTGVTRD